MRIAHLYIDSPVGRLGLLASDTALLAIGFDNPKYGLNPGECGPENPDHPILKLAARQLKEYFDQLRTEFDLPLEPRGTAFQLQVWQALLGIPYGETISYGELARRIGDPKASRAVGAANGQNPLPIVIPCHRVIGASGKLTGFGGGLEIKAKLLALESKQQTLDLF